MTDEKAREADEETVAEYWGTNCPHNSMLLNDHYLVCGPCADEGEDSAYDRGKRDGCAETLEACAAALQASLSEVLNDEHDEWQLVREWESSAARLREPKAEMRKRVKGESA